MEPLKEMFNSNFIEELAFLIKKNHMAFDSEKFVKLFDNKHFFELSLNERMRKITETLYLFMPDRYSKTLEVFKNTIPLMKPGYTTIIFPDYVGLYGLSDFKNSLDALKFFTTFGTSEFAIRIFLKNDFHATLYEIKKWTSDKNVHVRRLASEGTRPRLPWSFKLNEVIENPFLTEPILNALKNDNELYVKKSVANHLNDITKDNSDAFFEIIKKWDITPIHTKWIIKHAGRNLIKNGNSKMLSLIGVNYFAKISNFKCDLKNAKIKIGDYLSFDCSFVSDANQKLVIDYSIFYLKQKGIHTKKTFKLKMVQAQKGEFIQISKKQWMKNFSTRKLYPGTHYIQFIFNGVPQLKISFNLCF